jgi:hypothetical protein
VEAAQKTQQKSLEKEINYDNKWCSMCNMNTYLLQIVKRGSRDNEEKAHCHLWNLVVAFQRLNKGATNGAMSCTIT